MFSQAQDRLEAARQLARLELWEDAVNRAYYAMFCAARALLFQKESEPKTHAGLLSEFGRLYVKPGEFDAEMGRALREARDVRERADYAIRATVSEEEALDILADAERFVDAAGRLLDRGLG